jgi:hypothetical protein
MDHSAILDILEAEIGRIAYWSPSRQIVQETRAKWTRGVAQAIDHLLCKYEAMTSNSILPKKEAIQGFILPFHRNSRKVCKHLIKCLLAYILVSLHWIHRSHWGVFTSEYYQVFQPIDTVHPSLFRFSFLFIIILMYFKNRGLLCCPVLSFHGLKPSSSLSLTSSLGSS